MAVERLKAVVSAPGAAHTVNDLRTLVVRFHKLIQHLNVILQISIQRNGDVAQFPGSHQPGDQRIF